MDRELLPSIGALLSFESAARHGSFTRAASELNLSQGAVSRQVCQLEERLGVRLFERIRQKVVLTDIGRIYMREIAQILSALGDSTRKAMASGGTTGILNLAVYATFAIRWLVPRLPGFLEKNPNVTVRLSARPSQFDFSVEPFDSAIHFGSPVWAGTFAHHLMNEEIVVVCSAEYQRANRILKPADLSRAVLLHETTRPTAWSDWFRKMGVEVPNAFRGPIFDQFGMIAQAAISGLGVALLPKFLIEEELVARKLLPLFDVLRSDDSYCLMVPEPRAETPLVKAFTEWILQAASAPASAEPASRTGSV
jgi:LysR family glycine cleavage system transcriptional activator